MRGTAKHSLAGAVMVARTRAAHLGRPVAVVEVDPYQDDGYRICDVKDLDQDDKVYGVYDKDGYYSEGGERA